MMFISLLNFKRIQTIRLQRKERILLIKNGHVGYIVDKTSLGNEGSLINSTGSKVAQC